jgi:hypothetical protein
MAASEPAETLRGRHGTERRQTAFEEAPRPKSEASEEGFGWSGKLFAKVWSSIEGGDLCLSSQCQLGWCCGESSGRLPRESAALLRPPSATPITAKPITHPPTTLTSALESREVKAASGRWAWGLRRRSIWPPKHMSCR